MKITFKILKTGSGNDVYFSNLAKALNEAGIETEFKYYNKYFQFFPMLLKLYPQKSSGDIVHSNIDYGWALKEDDKPLILTLHHNVFEESFQKYVSFFQKIYYNLILRSNIRKSLKEADKIIAVSEYTKKSFIRSFGNADIEVIHNFVDTKIFRPLKIKTSDKRYKLLFVGNLIKRKGADLLPKIMKMLGKDYVLFFTSGLRTDIPEEFNQTNMVPLGQLTQMQLVNEYNKCDALLFPSRLEGFGYAVAEAMACGKPIISSNSSSIPELVTDNENGYLFEQDNMNEFVNKIKMLKQIRNTKRSNWQNNITKIRKDFSKNSIINLYIKSYESLI